MTTSAPAKPISKDPVITKNKWLIFIMIAKGCTPRKILGVKNDDGKPIVQYEFEGTDLAHEILDLYTRGLPIPVEDARTFENIERAFKNNVDRLARG